MHFHLDKVQDIGGFSTTNVEKGNYCWILTSASVNSDMAEFYMYIDGISNIFFNHIPVTPSAVYQFLLIIHHNLSADIYVNDFPVAIQVISKRDINKGEGITQEDIADIQRMQFLNIKISDTDKIVFCFKVGWKFGLFFDLDRQEKLNIDAMSLKLGDLYRYLSFQHIYKTLEAQTQFKRMIKDGWFPFIEIIGHEYKELSNAYKNEFNISNVVEEIIGRFNGARIEKITSRWWNKQVFQDKKPILEAGVSAFLECNNAGYITCIKILMSEIDGIIRLQYLKDTHKGKVPLQQLLTHIIEKGRAKTGSDVSLFLPSEFLIYLRDNIFAEFNLETGQLDLSRHSSAHGVARPEDYTKEKALQTILVLDQIYFYI
jgi:hypothetical protein